MAISQWYALQVYNRQEAIIANNLLQRDLESYVPSFRTTKKLSDRLKTVDRPLFPGYVFCQLQKNAWLHALTTPGVVRLVGAGQHPIPIEQSEMEALRQLEKTTLTRQAVPLPAIGERVRICAGPLKGTEGLLVRINEHSRLLLTISLLQRAVSVEVEPDWVTRL